MIHAIAPGLDAQTFSRILLSYLQARGCQPQLVDANTVTPDDFAIWDEFLTIDCCLLDNSPFQSVFQWLEESQVPFCWYQPISPNKQDLAIATQQMKRLRSIGGRIFLLLSKRLFKPTDTISNAIYIPAINETRDYLQVISDRGTSPSDRQTLALKLDGVYGKLAEYAVESELSNGWV